MAISDRLTKLSEDITSAYKSINDLGGTIPAHKNTENISVAIDSIYNRLPKVSGTGSDITLTPTLKGRLGSVLKGNTLQDGEPTPSSPVEIQSATGTQNVVVSGKNLVYSSTRSGNLLLLNGVTTTLDYIFKAGTYTISFNNSNNVSVYVKTATTEATRLGSETTKTFTLNEDFNLWFYRSGLTDNEVTDIQLEKGSQATTYQSYQIPQTQEVNLGDIKLYDGDKITGTPDNWSVVRENGEVVLDGSESWTLDGNTTDYYRYKLLTNGIDDENNLCSHFKYLLNYSSNTPHFYIGSTGNLYIFSDENSVANFKTWLSTHNTKVVYKLATPTTTPITDTYLISQLNALYNLQSYDDTTNISVEGNLPMILDVSALKGE